MNINLPHLQMPQMIPVNSAAITISSCFAEQADQLSDIKTYLQIHSQLFNILSSDDVAGLINWYDGRPKSMLLTIYTCNQAAIQLAFLHELLDEDETIEACLRDFLVNQGVHCERIDEVMDEFLAPDVSLKRNDDGLMFVDLGGSLME